MEQTTCSVPSWERVCRYCIDSSIDNEGHFLHDCVTFTLKRNCFFALLDTVVPAFLQLSREHKILTMLSPNNSKATELVSKFIGILFKARYQIDDGTPVQIIVCSFQTHNLSQEFDSLAAIIWTVYCIILVLFYLTLLLYFTVLYSKLYLAYGIVNK